MKKTFAIMLIAVMAAALLSGCAMNNKDGSYNGGNSLAMSSPGSIIREPMGGYGEAAPSVTYEYSTSASWTDSDGYDKEGPYTDSSIAAKPLSSAGSTGFSEKIIYTAYASIETVDFDETISNVYDLMDFNGAFIESSNIGGRNYAQSYYGWQTYRTARFTVRVPANRLSDMIGSLDVLGNVTSNSSEGQNITSQFYDTESRLSAYRIQEERLLAMLAKTETVADMIEIESRLSDVRYDIESMTSTLRNWQNLVDYSTLTLSINEVEKFTEYTPIQRPYWQQVNDGFGGTLRSIGDFFKDLLKWLIVNIPVIVILAVLVIIAVILIRRSIRRRSKKGEPDKGE